MIPTVCTAVALSIAPTGDLPVDQWDQASQYDTVISLFPVVPPTSAIPWEQFTFDPAFSAGKAIWNAFERGSSGGFDLLSLINLPERDWSGIQLVRELRQLSGLTWLQGADLVGVKPRTLHNWAAGHVIAEKNLRRLGELLAALRYIDQGYGEGNRDLLLNTSIGGQTLFSLLRTGEFERVKEHVGRGVGRLEPVSPLPQPTLRRWGPEHFGMALVESLSGPDGETFPVVSTRKRPAKARRKG